MARARHGGDRPSGVTAGVEALMMRAPRRLTPLAANDNLRPAFGVKARGWAAALLVLAVAAGLIAAFA